MGDNWADFRRRMNAFRKAGCCITVGTFQSDLAAIAAPIFNDDGAVIGSLARILNRTHAETDEELAVDICDAARQFSKELQKGADRLGTRNEVPSTVERDEDLLGSLVEHI
ncbi:IclR family transcriptional regulator C-terminal domain-containing protein [Ensifer sp. YR511]|uniref:IclR family transcriptional regulator domain-containing protein n=1 Tax=Ensifer sp. YR511 TaxID=1855294 RepID=UPI001FCD4B24|nr:IclR family transcriptional regulator C-terminal domain-containing protein [Ensifer sp. YR511]